MAKTIMEAAEALGKLIAESEERKNATASADALRNDETASEIMAKYGELRQEEMAKLQAKEPTKEELENVVQLLKEKEPEEAVALASEKLDVLIGSL